MSTVKKELEKVLDIKDEKACARAFEKFLKANAGSLPLPGEDPAFDRAMWAASEFTALSKKDESIVNRVTGKLLGEAKSPVACGVALKLKDLLGSTRETAVAAWQDMLMGLAWQQMVPAGALRGVGTQMVSLGTFQREVNEASIQVNLGWLVVNDQLRVLLQAKDRQEEALAEVELRITEESRGVVFSRKTNRDGTVVAPSVKVGPGRYKIEVAVGSEVAETPYFII